MKHPLSDGLGKVEDSRYYTNSIQEGRLSSSASAIWYKQLGLSVKAMALFANSLGPGGALASLEEDRLLTQDMRKV